MHEHLVRGGRERQREFRGACGIEHQPEVLHEDVDRRQRRVVAREHMRHAVLEHPAVAGAVRDDVVQVLGIDTFADAERHCFRRRRDVHAGKQLVDDLDLAAVARAVAQLVDLRRHVGEQAARFRVGLGPAGAHHRHLA